MADVRVRDMATASTPFAATDLFYVVQGTVSGDRQVAYANLTNPSGVIAGTYGDSSHVSRVTVNAQGFVTAASNVSIGGGTVTSVGLSMPAQFSVANSPVTTSGTLTVTWVNESANTVFAGPSTGSPAAPGFRVLVNADLPASGVTAATYGDSTHIPQVAVNAQGVITSASNIAVSAGTVSSVGLALPAEFSVSGSPVTSTGTLTATWINESANTIFAGPASGGPAAPGFRIMVNNDLPTSGATPGTFGDNSHVAQITVNDRGVITAVSAVGISGGGGGAVIGTETVLLLMGG